MWEEPIMREASSPYAPPLFPSSMFPGCRVGTRCVRSGDEALVRRSQGALSRYRW